MCNTMLRYFAGVLNIRDTEEVPFEPGNITGRLQLTF